MAVDAEPAAARRTGDASLGGIGEKQELRRSPSRHYAELATKKMLTYANHLGLTGEQIENFLRPSRT